MKEMLNHVAWRNKCKIDQLKILFWITRLYAEKMYDSRNAKLCGKKDHAQNCLLE